MKCIYNFSNILASRLGRTKKKLIFGIIAAAIIAVIIFSGYSEYIWSQRDSVTKLLSVIGVPFSIIFSSYTIYRSRRSEKHQGLIDTFKLLDDNGHRNARRRIYNLHEETIPERREKILLTMGLKKDEVARADAIHVESKEIVKADFNQIGYMIENDTISKNDFLRVYWYDVLKSWRVLSADINSTRINLKDPKYMYGFQQLQKNAITYMSKNKMISAENLKDVYVGPSVYVSQYVRLSSDREAIQAVFDLPMNKNSVEDKNLVCLKDPFDRKVDCEIQYNEDMKTLTFEINQNKLLTSGITDLKVIIKKEVRDRVGNQMLSDYEKMISIE
jgi:hypothetical protein